jgi:hypothetical protein
VHLIHFFSETSGVYSAQFGLLRLYLSCVFI